MELYYICFFSFATCPCCSHVTWYYDDEDYRHFAPAEASTCSYYNFIHFATCFFYVYVILRFSLISAAKRDDALHFYAG